MAKQKNQRIYSQDRAFLQNLADEQRDYIGRDYSLNLKEGLLIIFALPRKYKAKKETPKKDKKDRNKRHEKFERRER